jgi:hypothetical protein
MRPVRDLVGAAEGCTDSRYRLTRGPPPGPALFFSGELGGKNKRTSRARRAGRAKQCPAPYGT